MFFREIEPNSSNVRTKENLINLQELIATDHFIDLLKHYIVKHHELYTQPTKGTLIEELFVRVFNDMGLGELVKGKILGWYPNSHGLGADIFCPSLDLSAISCKTGEVKKTGRKKALLDMRQDHRIKYSSHRLTRHETLEEVLKFLSHNHCDITLCLSPSIKNQKYYLVAIKNIDFSKINWVPRYSLKTNKKTGDSEMRHVGWDGNDPEQGVIKAQISKSMSSQLWVELGLSSPKIAQMIDIG